MKEFEFQYGIKGKQSEGEIVLTDVTRGENKIIAEENFLELLKERGVDLSMVVLYACEELPEIEEEALPPLEDDTYEEDELEMVGEDYE